MYTKRVALFLLVALYGGLFAGSVALESPTIKIINDHVTCKETLVVFDLDNTVFDIAVDRWFGHAVVHAKSLGYDDLGAVKAVLPHYFERLAKSEITPAEDDTIGLIHSLQARGIPVIGLTTRSLFLSDRTQSQLQSIGLDFSKTAITPYHISFSLQEPAAFRHGIMFCGNNDKGDSLKAIFQATGYKPKKRMVFADDKEKYVKSVMKAASDLNIECIGIRYSCLDQKLNEFVLDEETKALIKPIAHKMIVEHSSIESVYQYITDNTMVLFDIDETVMRTERLPDQLGSGKWLAKLIRHAIDEHEFTHADIEQVILPHYYALQQTEPVVPVEDKTVQVIHNLQARNIPVMALTARRMEVMEATLRNVRSMGIDFSATAPVKETMSFSINHPNIFINGIMFCGGVIRNQAGETVGHAKDLAIKALLKHLPTRPARIVVIDDNPNYLGPIADAIVSLGIDCVGIRYSACDEHVKGIVLDEPSKALVRAHATQKAQN